MVLELFSFFFCACQYLANIQFKKHTLELNYFYYHLQVNVSQDNLVLSFESLYGGQFALSTQLIKPNYPVILPTDAAPQFLSYPPKCKAVLSRLPSAILLEITLNSMRYIICPKHSFHVLSQAFFPLSPISLSHGLTCTENPGMDNLEQIQVTSNT